MCEHAWNCKLLLHFELLISILVEFYCTKIIVRLLVATLCTELTRIQDGGYAAVNPTSPGYHLLRISFIFFFLSKPSAVTDERIA